MVKDGFKLVWKDSAGRRRQRIVAADRRGTERLLMQIVSERGLEISGLKPTGAFDLRFSELVAKYLADLATRVKPRQVASIKAHLNRLQKELGNPRVRDIAKDAISSYRQRRLGEGKANASINLEVGSLRAMCRLGVRMDLLGRNPIEGLPPLPGGKAHEKKSAPAVR